MVIRDSQADSDLLSFAALASADPAGPESPVALSEAAERPARPAAPTVSPVASAQPTRPQAVPAPPRGGMVARFRRRLFNPLGDRGDKADALAPVGRPDTADVPTPKRHDVGFKASLAEFLLINRLRARIRPKAAQPVQSADMLQRAEQIIYVTCKDWFGDGDSRSGDLGTRL